jgi:hypothetical protein
MIPATRIASKERRWLATKRAMLYTALVTARHVAAMVMKTLRLTLIG